VGVKGVKWDKEGTVGAGEYNIFYEKETKIINSEQDYLYSTAEHQQLIE
jgi:hypothetical protein